VAIDLVNDLIRDGAHVTAYDPKGNQRVQELDLCPGVHLTNSALEAVQDAEALVLATEWPEFIDVDFTEVRHRMHTAIVFDGRNLFDPATLRDLGFQYFGIGRPLASSSSRSGNGTSTRGDLLALRSN
jgi:UDPglucose 6-dehydrogenase